MDNVTRHIMRMLDEDTIGETSNGAPKAVYQPQDDALHEKRDHPIGDVTGQVPAPSSKGGGSGLAEVKTASQGAVRDSKHEPPNGMTDAELLRCCPNAMGRMSRMGGGQGY